MAGTLTVSGMAAGLPGGQEIIAPPTITGTTVIDVTYGAALASGDNTFTIPTGAVAALIIPPANNTTALKLRTSANAADVGLPLFPGSLPVVYPLVSPIPTSLIINAAGAIASATTIKFI